MGSFVLLNAFVGSRKLQLMLKTRNRSVMQPAVKSLVLANGTCLCCWKLFFWMINEISCTALNSCVCRICGLHGKSLLNLCFYRSLVLVVVVACIGIEIRKYGPNC